MYANSLPGSENSQFGNQSQVHTIVTTSIKICTRKREQKFLHNFREVTEMLTNMKNDIGTLRTTM